MVIFITPDELEPEFQNLWKMEYLKSPHIDYATNAIHAWYKDEDVIIFRFKNFGWYNDNRYNSYTLSAGPAGITINITRNTTGL